MSRMDPDCGSVEPRGIYWDRIQPTIHELLNGVGNRIIDNGWMVRTYGILYYRYCNCSLSLKKEEVNH